MKDRKLNPGVVVGVIALVFAIGGSAIALPGKNKVDSNDLKKNAVKTKAIANGAVTTSKLAGDAVDGAKIAAGAISGGKLADGAVNGAKLADGSVTTAKIADNAVTAPKLTDAALQPLELRNGYTEPGASLAGPQFAADGEGIVHLRGSATQASSAGGAMARLPVGSRPAKTVFAPAVCFTLGGIVPAMATIEGDGDITVTAADAGDQNTCENAGAASIDSISFPVGS